MNGLDFQAIEKTFDELWQCVNLPENSSRVVFVPRSVVRHIQRLNPKPNFCVRKFKRRAKFKRSH
jgi:hypothetical protein